MLTTPSQDSPVSNALALIGAWLRETGYSFTTVTPATHARVNSRQGCEQARSVRDIFGWSRPFDAALLPGEVLQWMGDAGLLETSPAGLRSQVRFSNVGRLLFAHSAWPTEAPDAVFFGPDTSRFTSLITHELQRRPLGSGARILDIGCGGGAGGIVAAMTCSSHDLLLADINPRALDFARGNARLNGLPDSRCSLSDLFTATGDGFDLIVANPPYLVDSARRAYRHGGGALGTELAERIAVEGLSRLAPGGRLVLYTGVPIQDGDDPFFAAVEPALKSAGAGIDYRELDPDVFGEELELPAYAGTDRIAAVALIATGG